MAEKKAAKETKKAIKAEMTDEVEETEELPIAETAPANTKLQGNYVFVGKKGAMAYVLAVVTQFGTGAKDVIVKARGKSISRAVDVAEIIKNRDPSIKVASITTATEEVQSMDGRMLKVSSIELTLKK